MTAMRIMQNDMKRELSQLGTHTFQVRGTPNPGKQRENSPRYGKPRNLTFAQVKTLVENPLLVDKVGVQMLAAYGEAVSRFGRTNPNIYLHGVNLGTFAAKNWVIAAGRGISSADLEAERNVCAIGDRVARRIFPNASPLGESIKFDGIPYLVIGVLEPKGEMFGEPQDNLVAIPITAALKRYGRDSELTLLVQAHDRASFEDLVAEVRGALRKIRQVPPADPDDFEISSKRFADETFPHPNGVVSDWRGHRRFDRAVCRGHWHHEHHARLHNRANERDWRATRDRSEEAKHCAAVHHRSGRHVPDRRYRGQRVGHSRGQPRSTLYSKNAARRAG